MTNKCPCNSNLEFDNCCKPFLDGTSKPQTAQALMRSRYTAFTLANVDYIQNTRHHRSQNKFNVEFTTKWASESTWHGLEIVNCKKGGKDDDRGEVEFIARYTLDNEKHEHRETASFLKENDRWFFIDGDYILPETFSRQNPKIGRNDPCPCGSGKKYKKCCA